MALELSSGKKKRSKSGSGDDAFRPSEFAPPAAGEDSLLAMAPPPPAPRAAPLTRRLSLVDPEGGKRTAAMIDRFLEWKLPLVGDRPIGVQIQALLILLGLVAVMLAAVIALDRRQGATGTVQIEITGDTLMHTQRLARSAPYALAVNAPAFEALRDSRDRIDANLEALTNGDRNRNLGGASSTIQPALARLADRWRTTQSAASIIARPIRSLIDPPGLLRSDFTQTSASGNSLSMRMCGVLPMVSRMELAFMSILP